MRVVSCEESVLVLGFNRPRQLSALIDRLREVEAPKVYVAIDGPRVANQRDQETVKQCRDLVENIDWTPDIHVRFPEHNLGCGLAVSSAIEWFLAEEERGIVLEDDVLASTSFFPYCSRLLDRYADCDQVVAVNGHNLVPVQGQSRPDLPYRFGRYTEMWGWALWRKSWANYSFDISDWSSHLEPRLLWERCGQSVPGALFWAAMFDMVARGQADTWDVQLVYSSMRGDRVMAIPNANLTENSGFDSDATHYFVAPSPFQPVATMTFPMSDVAVEVDRRADKWLLRNHFQAEIRIQQVLKRKSPGFQEYVAEILELHRKANPA